jgi:coenzyme PQQ synthesis protein D (PqqD)
VAISTNSVVVAAPVQVSCAVGTETVVLHFNKGLYFGLDEVGSVIWNQLQSPRLVSEIRDAIVREYDVSPEQCERDLLALLQRLLEQALIEVRPHAQTSSVL